MVRYISCIDLTPWQESQLRKVCVSIKSENYQGHTIHAVGIDIENKDLIMQIIENEEIKYVPIS